jgi:hypothetical protein
MGTRWHPNPRPIPAFRSKARTRALRQEARGIPTRAGATVDPAGAQRYLDADRRIAEINKQLGDV